MQMQVTATQSKRVSSFWFEIMTCRVKTTQHTAVMDDFGNLQAISYDSLAASVANGEHGHF